MTEFPERRPVRSISRRGLFQMAGVLAVPASEEALFSESAEIRNPAPGSVQGPPGRSGQIIRQREPENFEFPFDALESVLTPNDRFYVRNHFARPRIELASWRLEVTGSVRNALSLTLDELRKLPSRTLVCTMECAGNSRVFLSPPAKGVQWELGAVSTAEWTGVPLIAVLERAGIRPEALEVVLEGADSGEIKDPPRPAGPLHFARSMPLTKARQPDVLLAYRMNGVDLPPEHGFPLRAVVPGWYGMASIKWLTRVVVVDTPFQGFFQTIDYARWESRNGQPVREPLRAMQVKAAIARPAMRESIPAGQPYRVHGAAWAGEEEVAKVEVSIDGGRTWELAHLEPSPGRYAWSLWSYSWQVPARSGPYRLMARATDRSGRTQPERHDANNENYVIHHILPVEGEVR